MRSLLDSLLELFPKQRGVYEPGQDHNHMPWMEHNHREFPVGDYSIARSEAVARRGRKCCNFLLVATFRNTELFSVTQDHQWLAGCTRGQVDVTEEFRWQVLERRRSEREAGNARLAKSA